MTPAPKQPSAAEVLAALNTIWIEHGLRQRWMSPFSIEEQDTILRALRVLAACEDAPIRGFMSAMHDDGWNNASGVMRFLGKIATLTGGPEDGR